MTIAPVPAPVPATVNRTCAASPCAGGEKILDVFELKLKEAINKLPFQKILTLKNVQVRTRGRLSGACGVRCLGPAVF